MSWAKAIAFVLKHEGGYVNDPRDPGGETKYGISKRAFPIMDIASLTQEQAEQIYRESYWNQFQGDLLPEPWDLLLLDATVNQGLSRAIRTLQKSLGVTADGVMGRETLTAIQRAPGEAVDLYLADRLLSYVQTANFDVYGRGWFKRTVSAARK